MRCGKAKKWLMAYHDGELASDRRARLAGHLEGCDGCRALLERLDRADGAALIPEPGAGYWDDFTDRVMDRVLREREKRRQDGAASRPKWVFALTRFAPALSIALVVVVAAGVLTRMKSPTRSAVTYPKEAPAADQAALSRKGRPTDSDRAARDMKSETEAADRLEDRRVVVGEGGDRAVSRAVVAQPEPMAQGGDASGKMAPPSSVQAPPEKARPLQGSTDSAALRAAGEMDVNRAAAMTGPKPGPELANGTAAPPFPGVLEYAKGPKPEAVLAESMGPAAAEKPAAEGPVSQFDAARKLADAGRYADSERLLKDLLSQRPPDLIQEKASILLVRVLEFQDRLPEAQSVLDEARRRHPESDLVQGFELKMEGEDTGR